MTSVQEIKDIFNELDVDKSGYLEINELEELCKRAGMNIDAENLKKYFEELDVDNDKKVCLVEFLAYYKFNKSSRLGEYIKKMTLLNRSLKSIKPAPRVNIESAKRTKNFSFKISDGTLEEYKTSIIFRIDLGKSSSTNKMIYEELNKVNDCAIANDTALTYFILHAKNAEILKEDITVFFKTIFEMFIEMMPDLEDHIKDFEAKMQFIVKYDM